MSVPRRITDLSRQDAIAISNHYTSQLDDPCCKMDQALYDLLEHLSSQQRLIVGLGLCCEAMQETLEAMEAQRGQWTEADARRVLDNATAHLERWFFACLRDYYLWGNEYVPL